MDFISVFVGLLARRLSSNKLFFIIYIYLIFQFDFELRKYTFIGY